MARAKPKAELAFPTEQARPLVERLLGAMARKAKPDTLVDRSMERAAFGVPDTVPDYGAPPKPKRQRATRSRNGGWRTYATLKRNDARPGTWRHYMLQTILDHTNTLAANAAHAQSGWYTGNKLDFNWSAKAGYIAFD